MNIPSSAGRFIGSAALCSLLGGCGAGDDTDSTRDVVLDASRYTSLDAIAAAAAQEHGAPGENEPVRYWLRGAGDPEAAELKNRLVERGFVDVRVAAR